jgi:hypothetical protein
VPNNFYINKINKHLISNNNFGTDNSGGGVGQSFWDGGSRLFIHDTFFGPLGLHLLVWSEHRRSQPFQPILRYLRMQWSWAFNLMFEVALGKSQHGGNVPTFEPQETLKILLIFIKSPFWLFYAQNSNACVESWV